MLRLNVRVMDLSRSVKFKVHLVVLVLHCPLTSDCEYQSRCYEGVS